MNLSVPPFPTFPDSSRKARFPERKGSNTLESRKRKRSKLWLFETPNTPLIKPFFFFLTKTLSTFSLKQRERGPTIHSPVLRFCRGAGGRGGGQRHGGHGERHSGERRAADPPGRRRKGELREAEEEASWMKLAR